MRADEFVLHCDAVSCPEYPLIDECPSTDVALQKTELQAGLPGPQPQMWHCCHSNSQLLSSVVPFHPSEHRQPCASTYRLTLEKNLCLLAVFNHNEVVTGRL